MVEFPADADLAELYGVVSNIKEELWKALEKQKEDEAPKVEPEVSAKIEELVTE